MLAVELGVSRHDWPYVFDSSNIWHFLAQRIYEASYHHITHATVHGSAIVIIRLILMISISYAAATLLICSKLDKYHGLSPNSFLCIIISTISAWPLLCSRILIVIKQVSQHVYIRLICFP